MKKIPGFETIDIKAAVQFFQNRKQIMPSAKELLDDGAAFGNPTDKNDIRYY